MIIEATSEFAQERFPLRRGEWSPSADPLTVKSFYDLKAPSLEGDTVDLAAYRGMVTLVVNVASQCGYIQVGAFFPSPVAPESPELRAAIERALATPPR